MVADRDELKGMVGFVFVLDGAAEQPNHTVHTIGSGAWDRT